MVIVVKRRSLFPTFAHKFNLGRLLAQQYTVVHHTRSPRGGWAWTDLSETGH